MKNFIIISVILGTIALLCIMFARPEISIQSYKEQFIAKVDSVHTTEGIDSAISFCYNYIDTCDRRSIGFNTALDKAHTLESEYAIVHSGHVEYLTELGKLDEVEAYYKYLIENHHELSITFFWAENNLKELQDK